MFFFSFSFSQVQILEKNINRGASFVKVYLILTIAKILCSAFFIISYGMLKADEASLRFYLVFCSLSSIYFIVFCLIKTMKKNVFKFIGGFEIIIILVFF